MPSQPYLDPSPAGSGEVDGQKDPPRRSLIRDLVEVVVLAALIYLIIQFAIMPVHVEGTSMYATLQNNNLLIAERVSLYLGGPSRGDIVIVKPPIPSTNDFIKRVIGLPGEWVRIGPDSHGIGHVYVSDAQPTSATGGMRLKEPYLNGVWRDEVVCCTVSGTSSPLLPTTGRWARIPLGDYFVMGDNRNFSEDSRTFGWEPRSGVKAIAIARFWPVAELGLLPGARPTVSMLMAAGMFLPLRRRRPFRGKPSDRLRAPS